MRVLSLALYAEGPTDLEFFSPLLGRLCQSLCAKEQIGIANHVHQRHNGEDVGEPRAQSLRRFANSLDGAFDLMFVHADGAGDPGRACVEQIDPGREAILAEVGGRARVIALVPVREMEAWALVDGDAFREVLGSRVWDEDLGLPAKARLSESVTDPKVCLQDAINRAVSGGRRRRRKSGPPPYSRYLRLLGETISLEHLRLLEAFQSLEAETEQALRSLRFLR